MRGFRVLALISLALLAACQQQESTSNSASGVYEGEHALSIHSADLLPPAWPVGELEKYNSLNNQFETERPLVQGEDYIIGGIQSALGVGAGIQVLRKGGNAMDAALTAALAQTVVQGGYGVSFAGFLNLVYYEAATGKIHILNAGYNTVAGEDDPLGIPTLAESGPRGTMVPGFMAGIGAAHERFGSIPFEALFAPAIWFAREGITVPTRLASMIQWKGNMLLGSDTGRSIFTDADGELLQTGDLFQQLALADTLEAVSKNGWRYMYDGHWGRRFVEEISGRGGKLTQSDLTTYQPKWQQPLLGEYQGMTVATMPEPNYGGYQLLEMLNLIEAANLADSGSQYNSAEAMAKFLKLSRVGGYLEKRVTHNFGSGYGDLASSYLPGIGLDATARISKDQAGRLVSHLSGDSWPKFEKAVLERKRIDIEKWDKVLADMEQPQRSDCVIVRDQQGNLVSMLHTFNGLAWGYGLFVDGVSIPDSGVFQQQLIAATGPGQRLPDPTMPLIITRNGKPYMATCNVGSWLHPSLTQFLYNNMTQGHALDQSSNLPKFWKPSLKDGVAVHPVGRGELDTKLPEAVQALGEHIEEIDHAGHYGRTSYVVAVKVEENQLSGAVTKVFNGAVSAKSEPAEK